MVPGRPRKVILDPQKPKIQAIVGPRRAGKSSILRIAIDRLLSSGIGWDRICYLNCEDERLLGMDFEPELILQAFRELYPENPQLRDVFFFFDEVQHLSKWEHFINRIHEQVNKQILITGSNSQTLHTEVASVLRGRGLPVELLPLSFSEYLKWKEIPFTEYGVGKSRVFAAFIDYLSAGGYPELIYLKPGESTEYLQEYFNSVLYRDIIDREKPANYTYLRYLFHRIASNTGKPTGLRKIFNELKSRGYSVGLDRFYEMADLGEAVYLFKRISKFDPSIIKRENSDKKCYFIDNGMLRSLTSSRSDNMGMLLENLVFWHLYRQYGNIYTSDIFYYKEESAECDFVLYREGGQALPVQVTWSLLSDDTRKRELKGLVKACRKINSKTGILITSEDEEFLELDEIRILIIPAWKWCGMEYDLYGL